MKEPIVVTMPSTPAEFAGVEWNDVARWYEQLAEAPLTADSRDDWLEAWSRLEELLPLAAAATG